MSFSSEQTITVPLRLRDIDALGHLNQAVYHELLEEGRWQLVAAILRELGEAVEGTYVVAHVDLDYRHEVRIDHGEVEIATRIAGVGESSLRLEQDVRLPDGTLAAEGHVVLVGWDFERRGKRMLNAAERALLSRTG